MLLISEFREWLEKMNYPYKISDKSLKILCNRPIGTIFAEIIEKIKPQEEIEFHKKVTFLYNILGSQKEKNEKYILFKRKQKCKKKIHELEYKICNKEIKLEQSRFNLKEKLIEHHLKNKALLELETKNSILRAEKYKMTRIIEEIKNCCDIYCEISIPAQKEFSKTTVQEKLTEILSEFENHLHSYKQELNEQNSITQSPSFYFPTPSSTCKKTFDGKFSFLNSTPKSISEQSSFLNSFSDISKISNPSRNNVLDIPLEDLTEFILKNKTIENLLKKLYTFDPSVIQTILYETLAESSSNLDELSNTDEKCTIKAEISDFCKDFQVELFLILSKNKSMKNFIYFNSSEIDFIDEIEMNTHEQITEIVKNRFKQNKNRFTWSFQNSICEETESEIEMEDISFISDEFITLVTSTELSITTDSIDEKFETEFKEIIKKSVKEYSKDYDTEIETFMNNDVSCTMEEVMDALFNNDNTNQKISKLYDELQSDIKLLKERNAKLKTNDNEIEELMDTTEIQMLARPVINLIDEEDLKQEIQKFCTTSRVNITEDEDILLKKENPFSCPEQLIKKYYFDTDYISKLKSLCKPSVASTNSLDLKDILNEINLTKFLQLDLQESSNEIDISKLQQLSKLGAQLLTESQFFQSEQKFHSELPQKILIDPKLMHKGKTFKYYYSEFEKWFSLL